MNHKLLLAVSLLTLTAAAQARPFEDPRSDRIPALDTAAANEPRDPGCVADQLASTGGPVANKPPHARHSLARLFQFRACLQRADRPARCLFRSWRSLPITRIQGS